MNPWSGLALLFTNETLANIILAIASVLIVAAFACFVDKIRRCDSSK